MDQTEIILILKEALKFYANPETYRIQRYPCRCGARSRSGTGCNDSIPITDDMGFKAQEALDITSDN